MYTKLKTLLALWYFKTLALSLQEQREHVVKQMQRMIVQQHHVKMEACVSINYITTAACVRQDIQEQRKHLHLSFRFCLKYWQSDG